jgi:hypothetical protein
VLDWSRGKNLEMKLYQLLIISVLFHLGLLWLAWLLPANFSKTSRTQEIQLVYQNETKNSVKDEKYFVSDYNREEDDALDILKKKVKRLSRITRRVKEELLAKKSGPSQNQVAQKMQSDIQKQLKNDLKPNDLHSLPSDITDKDSPSITKPMPDSVAKNTQMGDSSIENFIPDVKMGGFTSLNSDQFVYYTFYARTNEQIRNRWIENIRHFLSTTPQTEINRLSSKTQISNIEVLLNRKGHFVRALVHQQAENAQLDESAIAAFRLASPLNNPPEEMVSEDGYIHLYYGFYLGFKPRYIASGSK